jgi:formylglycine-generating enzyme required for sulfatase activity
MFCNYCRASNPDDGLYCSRCGRSLKSTPSSSGNQPPVRDTPTEMTLPIGTILLDRYRIIRELGAGGMGRVYEAHDEKLDMPVAIKMLRDILSRDPGSVKRLIAEARHSMLLSHANVVRVHNFEDGPTVKFLVMEYVEGDTLAHRLAREGRISEEETRKIAIEICRGLEHAHGKKIIHRDLKPGNILLGKDGSIKVADFGIARLCRDSVSRLTSQHDSGTLLYMSPEQLDGESGEASDIYSLGVVLYEMLSGDPPFVSGEVTAQIRHKIPRSIEGVSEDLNRIVLKCLEKKPENRFASLRELHEEIEGAAERRRQSASGQAQYLEMLRTRGAKAFDDKKFTDAIELWEQALALNPNDAALKEAISLARRQCADSEKREAERRRAEEAAERERRLEADRKQRFEALKTRGTEAAAAGNDAQAISLWNQALDLSPGNADLTAAIAAAQYRAESGRLEAEQKGAERTAAEDALKQWIDSMLAHVDSLMSQGHPREAEQDLLQALSYAPGNALLTERLAKCREKLQEPPMTGKTAAAAKVRPKVSRLRKILAVTAAGAVLLLASYFYYEWSDSRARSIKSPEFGGTAAWENTGGSAAWQNTGGSSALEPPGSKPALTDSGGAATVVTAPEVSKPRGPVSGGTGAGSDSLAIRKAKTDEIAKQWESFFKDDGPPENASMGTTWRSPVDGREMTWIPPGTFSMGSPPNEIGRSIYEQLHTVSIGRGFWMDISEVTNEAYQEFVLANPQWQRGRIATFYHDGHYLEDWNGTQYPVGRGNYPVLAVSWHAARAYAQWAEKRLPTEAEWEYAYRAGTTTTFWWGDYFNPTRANNSHTALFPAGDPMHRNGWGLYDMAGSVGEWTSSLFMAYPFRSNDGRENLQVGGNRVIRGGAWNSDTPVLRAASRAGVDPSFSAFSVGFRCAR